MCNVQSSQVDTDYNPPAGKSGPRTAQNRAELNPLLPLPTDDLSASITSEYVSINKDVLNAQEKIIAAVFDYLGHIHSPVDAVNDLLYDWLLTAPNWNKPFNAERLKTLFNLTGLLFDLQSRLTSLHYFETEAEKLQQAQGGPNHD